MPRAGRSGGSPPPPPNTGQFPSSKFQTAPIPCQPICLPRREKGARGCGVMKTAQPLPWDGRRERILGEITGITLFSRGKNNHGKHLQLQLITDDYVTAV